MNGWNDTVCRRPMLILPALIVFVAGLLFGMALSAAQAARAVDCSGWMSDDEEVMQRFYTDITAEKVLACLAAGADPNAASPNGLTPLHVVAFSTNDPDTIVALLGSGADPDARARHGLTPLHGAAFFNQNHAVIVALLEAGADPNALADDGPAEDDWDRLTPLHLAAVRNGNPAVITALLEGGADPDARDEDGRTPLDVAREENRPAVIIAALEEAAGVVDGASPPGAGASAVDELFSDEHIITRDADWAFSVFAADLDGDGDTDVLSASVEDDTIAWYENRGKGAFYGQRVITRDADGAIAVFAADLDGDGDADALSASWEDDTIAWYENLGGGAFSGQRVITQEAAAASSIFAADLDGDGDADVLSASWEDDKIAWYENLGGGAFSGQRVITQEADAASSVFAADLDGDGDTDVLSASAEDDTIAWYENRGGGAFSGERVITMDAKQAYTVFAADLDGDGDADVLSASWEDDKIVWYGNIGAGKFSEQRIIARDADGAGNVFAADLDGDGDLDVLAASYEFETTSDDDVPFLDGDDKIAWYENLGGGAFGRERVITKKAASPTSVFAADLDGDGDADVLSASNRDDTIAWYENLSPVNGDQAVDVADALEATTAPPVDCEGWMSGNDDWRKMFYENITPEKVLACIEAGYDPNLRGRADVTPLHLAAVFTKNPAVIATFVAAGADLNARARHGMTPLFMAAAYGQNPAVIAALVHAGADPNVRGGDAMTVTPLHGAAAGNPNPAVIGALLDGGADPDARDEDGNTPLDLAKSETRPADIIAALEAAAGAVSSADEATVSGYGDVEEFAAAPEVLAAKSETVMPAREVSFSDRRVIARDADGARSVFAADLDGDGDADVLSASWEDDKIAWYENLGAGAFSDRRLSRPKPTRPCPCSPPIWTTTAMPTCSPRPTKTTRSRGTRTWAAEHSPASGLSPRTPTGPRP